MVTFSKNILEHSWRAITKLEDVHSIKIPDFVPASTLSPKKKEMGEYFGIDLQSLITLVCRFHCFTSGALQYAMTTPSSSATAEFGQCRESALNTVRCWTMPISRRRPSQIFC